MAFKGVPETDDIRGSMSCKVLDELRKKSENLQISLYDPVISIKKLQNEFLGFFIHNSFNDAILNKDVVIIANNHPSFEDHNPLDIKINMADNGFIYDYWNHFSSLSNIEMGDFYFAVGNIRR